MRNWLGDNIEWVIGAALVIALVLAVVSISKEGDAWVKYSADHHCEAKGVKQGQIGTGITSSGKVTTTFTPDQTIYVCDGGEMVIR